MCFAQEKVLTPIDRSDHQPGGVAVEVEGGAGVAAEDRGGAGLADRCVERRQHGVGFARAGLTTETRGARRRPGIVSV